MITEDFLAGMGDPIVVTTHVRSGTHLAIDLLRRQFRACRAWKWPGEANDTLYLALDVLSGIEAAWGESRAKRNLKRADRPLLKAHWTAPDLGNLRQRQPDLAACLERRGRFVHVVRNPYRVIASQWAWEHSAARIEVGPGVDWVEGKAAYWAQHGWSWAAREGCLLLRFEDIISSTGEVLDQLAAYLDLVPEMRIPLLPPKLRGFWHSRCNRAFAVRPASTEILTRQKAASPRDLFSPEAVRAVIRVAGEWMIKNNYSWDPEKS